MAFKSPNEAGREMLKQAWSHDKSENMLDCYSMITIEGILKRFFDAEGLDYEAEKIKARHMPLDTEMLNRFIFG